MGILVAGVVLLVLGLNATDTFGEEVRQEFTGEYSDQTVWYIVGGSAGIVVGGGLAVFGGKLQRPAA
ncbi:MAG: DUF3185 family protein [Planctomycetota bacterium]